MPDDTFAERVQQFSMRLAQWRAQVPAKEDDAPRALMEINTIAEELRTAEEELRQQNEELVATQILLEEERERYRDLFELAPDGYFVTDDRGVIREANRAAGRLLGIQPQFLVGKSLLKYIHVDDGRTARHQISMMLHTHAPTEWTARFMPRALPSFYGAVTIAAMVRDTGVKQQVTGIRWLLRDASDRVRAEARARALAAEVEELRAQQVSLLERERADGARERTAREQAEAEARTKDNFLALISHELRNPMTPVLIALDRLLAGPAVTPEQCRGTLELMRRNLQAECRLIDDMLDVTRIVHGKLELRREPLALHDLLDDVLAGAREALKGKGVKLHVRHEAGAPVVHGDPTRLRQVFWNLLNNALKFTPSGGEVHVRTAVPPTRERSGDVLIEVRDTGIGIAPESLKGVFNAYEQANSRFARAQGGLGLGLSIVRSLVDAHGGTIEVQSRGAGRGTTFRIYFPLTEESLAVAPGSSAVAVGGESGLSICLVDDHLDTLAALSKLLRQLGHRVSVASTLAEGLELLTARAFDLVISDLHLPDGSGCDLLARVAPSRIGRAVLLSGAPAAELDQECRRAGFTDHLRKPISVEQVQRLLTSIKPSA